MADNIIIKITSEADLNAAQKQLQELTQRMKEQERAIHDLTEQEKDDAESIKKTIFEREKLNKALRENKRYYNEEKNAAKEGVAATKQSIKELENQVKAYKTFTGQSGRMVQQLRAMCEELHRMEDAGEFGTKAFMDLAIQAAKLENQIGDTQQRIRVLSSDTLELDTIMGVGEGLAGAFYVATSAAEVFGADMEGLQNAFYKVQAAMSVMNGVQQIANTLNKDSVVSIVLQNAAFKLKEKFARKSAAAVAADTAAMGANTAVTGAQAAATTAATGAQWSLNAAMDANPIGAILTIIVAAVAAVGALAVGLWKMVDAFSAAGRAQRDYEKAAERLGQIEVDHNRVIEMKAAQIEANNIKIERSYNRYMTEAKKRNASELEMLELERLAAQKRKDENTKLIEEQIKKQKELVKETEKAYKDAAKVADNTNIHNKKKLKKAEEQLAEAQSKRDEAVLQLEEMTNAQLELEQQVTDAELNIARQKLELDKQLTASEINLMKDGANKEIAIINQSYKERLDALNGNSAEELALRVSLMAEQEKEIAAVRKKYALEAQQVAIQEQKNLLKENPQQVELAKQIAKAEADAKIAALDKENMSRKAYAAEVKAIELELAETLRSIDEGEINRINENAKRKTEILVAQAEAEAKALTGEETASYQSSLWDAYYQARKKQIEENAQIEIDAINRSTDSEEVKADRIKQVNLQLSNDLNDINKESAEKQMEIDGQRIAELERVVEETERAISSGNGGKLDALRDNLNAQNDLYDAQLAHLKDQYSLGLISYQEYKDQEWEITKAIADAEAQYVQDKMQTIADGMSTALGYMQEISDMAFEAMGNNIQAELDALDEMYTTDAEEAKKNADKKYITEKELADKKAALEMKQAKFNKAQALINAGINTALAITSALTAMPPMSFIMAGIAAAMGAAQIGVISAKPLAQYEKGRKGGKGEYALVGEKGPEIMYVPEGASIVPNHYLGDMDAWEKFGVPAIADDTMAAAMMMQYMSIDYDKLGKAVAANIPQQKAVSVNVDRSGVTISDNGNRRTYLNKKYNGVWL